MLRFHQLFFVIILVITAFALTWYTFSDRTSVLSTASSGQEQAVYNVYKTNDLPSDGRLNGTFEHTSGHAPTGSQRHAHYERAPPTPFNLRIVAIGDLHGYISAAVEALIVGRVVDAHGHWIGGKTYLVQTGDIIDQGPDTIKLFAYMDALREEARKAGGDVISLLGNHEYMNLLKNWLYVTPAEKKTFGDDVQRWKALTTGSIGISWRDHYRVACRFPLHPSLGPINTDYDGKKTHLSHSAIAFVHGGLSPVYPELTPFPSNINNIGQTALQKLQNSEHNKLDNKEARLSSGVGGDSPLWYRGWALPDELPDCAQVDAVLEKTGTRRMIMGHSAQLGREGILKRCDGKILVIDTGISHYYSEMGGIISALSIDYSLTPKPGPAGNAGTTWEEREVITALYQGGSDDAEQEEEEFVPSEVLVDSQREITEPFTA